MFDAFTSNVEHTQFYSEDFMWQGEQKAQRKMRTALGLD